MKWEGDRESDNFEDRRGEGGYGGGGGFSFGGGSLGIGSVVIALVASYFLGINPLAVLNMLSGGTPVSVQAPARPHAQQRPEDERTVHLVRTVLAYTEDAWGEIFRAQGMTYKPPRLAVFTGSTPTACGTGRSATGPFYCPGDQRIYIDLDFYRLMAQRFGVAGEFAQSYVIAHEVGHHVQNLLGISGKVHQLQQQSNETRANALSVRLELQADCFAGVWAQRTNQVKSILEPGDVESAIAAATAIGDDALQRQARGEVMPDSFTHGSSAQRVRWLRRGLESGNPDSCNTFEAHSL